MDSQHERPDAALPRPRLTDHALPPYSYVPGHHPHPVSDPAGHMHGVPPQTVAPLDPVNWRDSTTYLYAIDLFNHGYYWEAHEAWEGLWHAADRRGPTADFLKGLIKLAAAAVKAREGNPRGVVLHAKRAVELLGSVASGGLEDDTARAAGLNPKELAREATLLSQSTEAGFTAANPTLLLDIVLRPR